MNATYAVCIHGDAEPPASLVAGNIYHILPDAISAEEGWIRVIDESEEDYLYPASRFIVIGFLEEYLPDDARFLPIELTPEVERELYAPTKT